MSQTLGPRALRRIARDTGCPTITRGDVPHGTGPVVLVGTWDHEHAWYDRRSKQLVWLKEEPIGHLPSCYGPDGQLLLNLEPFEDDGRWPTLRD